VTVVPNSVHADFDPAKAEAFAGRFLTALNNGALCLMVSVGHRTGLFDVMSTSPTGTSEEIAPWAACGISVRHKGATHDLTQESVAAFQTAVRSVGRFWPSGSVRSIFQEGDWHSLVSPWESTLIEIAN